MTKFLITRFFSVVLLHLFPLVHIARFAAFSHTLNLCFSHNLKNQTSYTYRKIYHIIILCFYCHVFRWEVRRQKNLNRMETLSKLNVQYFFFVNII